MLQKRSQLKHRTFDGLCNYNNDWKFGRGNVRSWLKQEKKIPSKVATGVHSFDRQPSVSHCALRWHRSGSFKRRNTATVVFWYAFGRRSVIKTKLVPRHFERQFHQWTENRGWWRGVVVVGGDGCEIAARNPSLLFFCYSFGHAPKQGMHVCTRAHGGHWQLASWHVCVYVCVSELSLLGRHSLWCTAQSMWWGCSPGPFRGPPPHLP